jgi:hypothetical protein
VRFIVHGMLTRRYDNVRQANAAQGIAVGVAAGNLDDSVGQVFNRAHGF